MTVAAVDRKSQNADAETADTEPAPPRREPETPEVTGQADVGAITGGAPSVAGLVALQATAGNQAVAQLMERHSGGDAVAEPVSAGADPSAPRSATDPSATASDGVAPAAPGAELAETGGQGTDVAPDTELAVASISEGGGAGKGGSEGAELAGSGAEGDADGAAEAPDHAVAEVAREPAAVQAPTAADVGAQPPAEQLQQQGAPGLQALSQLAAKAGGDSGPAQSPGALVGAPAESVEPGGPIAEANTITADAAAQHEIAAAAQAEAAATVGSVRDRAAQLAGVRVDFLADGGPADRDQAGVSSDLISAFLAAVAQRAELVLDSAAGVPEPIQAAAEVALAAVPAAAEAQSQLVVDHLAQLRVDTGAEAQAARDLITTAHSAAADAIRAATAGSRSQLEGEYTAAVQATQQRENDQLAALDEKYRQGDERFRAAGQTVGGEAERRGAELAAAYVTGVSDDDDDGFWDDDPVIRKAKARRDTANEVAKGYKDGLVAEANSQADQALQGKARDIETVHTTARQATESLTSQWTAVLATLAGAESAALGQAETSRTALLTGVDQALDGVNQALTSQSQTLLGTITESSTLQAETIRQQAAALIAQLQGQLSEAADGLVQSGQALAEQSQGAAAPAPEDVADSLAEGSSRLDEAVAQAQADAETGMSTAGQTITDAATAGVDGLVSATQDGLAGATAAGSEGATAIGGIAGSAAESFAGIQQSHEGSLAEAATSTSGGFAQVVTGVDDSYSAMSGGLERGFNESAAGLEQGLRGAIPRMESDISSKAEENASHVPPRWKNWLRWILIIAVILVVALVIGPFVIGAVGAALGTGAVMTGIIAGAIVGGATSATIQMINNVTENRATMEGVGKAALIGAIGGAVGGGFGAWVGQLGQQGVAVANTSFRQFLLNTGANIVTENSINLATGQLTWKSFLMSVGTAVAVGGAMHAASGLKPISSIQEASMGAGARAGGGARSWMGEVFGSTARSDSVPEVDVGLSDRGTRPEPGERSMTREEWKAQNSRERAERSIANTNEQLEPNATEPNREGHGHDRHGYETTDAQQAERVRSGTVPDRPAGPPGNKPGRASRFRSAEAEAEALGRGQSTLESDLSNGTVPAHPDPITGQPTFVRPDGRPVRWEVSVTTNHPEGFGTSHVPQRVAGPGSQAVVDASGNRIPLLDPAPLHNATVVYEYVPSAGEWRPLTYYPDTP